MSATPTQTTPATPESERGARVTSLGMSREVSPLSKSHDSGRLPHWQDWIDKPQGRN